MFIVEMFEGQGKRLVVTYPGRFQPFHKGHRDVFASLQAKFGNDNVFIVTGDKTDTNKSPFNFNDKVQFMNAAGVNAHSIIEAAKVYDLPDQFKSDTEDIIFVTAVGEPDAKRLNPGSVKKDGNPSYFQQFPADGDLSKLETADKHGYVIIAHERPEVIKIGGNTVDVSHGTPTRALWNEIRNDEKLRGEFLMQLYGRNDPELGRILDKIPQAVNEDAAGVGVVKNGNDPRYVMATTGDDNDVTAATLEKMMRAYHLIGTKKVTKEDRGTPDIELRQIRQFAQQHYPGLSSQEAFEKFVQRSLKHAKAADDEQYKELASLEKRVSNLEKNTPENESTLHKYKRDRFKTLDQREQEEEAILKQAMNKVQSNEAESFDGEYDDEAGMAQSNLHTIARAAQGLIDTIDNNENLPEWAQEKLAKVEGMLVSVWDYLLSQEEQGIDPRIDEMFDEVEEMVESLAAEHGIDSEAVWESLESVSDQKLIETAAWRRKEGKSKTGGLNAKGVASYRRENPGSKLQTAVTTKPSKLKKGSKAAKRRKSFCARMGGVKGPMKKPNGKPTRKALALRKWNCESTEQTVQMLESISRELSEMKQRLDPKCWKGYKKQGTKVKDGVRVNNCVKIDESALKDMDDYKAKKKALQDIQLDPQTHKDPQLKAELAKRKADLEKEAKAKGYVAEGVALPDISGLGYNAQSLIMKLRRDVEEKRIHPTPQAVLAAARELAGEMEFAPQLLVKQVLGKGVAEAFIAPALSAANANAEYERTRTHLGGYKGRVDTEVSSKEEYLSVGKALQRAAKQSGQHVEYGLSDNKMSIFSDSMNSDELDEFIDNALESLQESYPKHQDLSGISTDKLKAYLARQGQQQGSGEGNQVKRVRAELQRREQNVEEAFANPGSGSTGTSRGAKRIANTVRKALAKNAETPEQRAARKDFEARFDAERRKQQGVAEGGVDTGNMPVVRLGGTVAARPAVKAGSLVKAQGLDGVWRVDSIRGDNASITMERPNTGVSRNIPISALRVWTNKPVGVSENYDDEDEDSEQGFFVALGSEDDGGFVGMIVKDGGKWREVQVSGNAPYNWGGSYMGYLQPEDVMSWIRRDYRNSDVAGPFSDEASAMEYASRQYGLDESLRENAEELNIGDDVIITGPVEFKGKTGVISDFGEMKRFVVVDLYNHGKHSFHSSDVSFNEYADSEEEESDLDRNFYEGMYEFNSEDPYNSEFAPSVGMGRMTLRGWKQSLIRRVKQLSAELEAAGQQIDNADLWDRVYAKLKSANLDPVAQEIELAHKELEGIRRKGGTRSRAFKKG